MTGVLGEKPEVSPRKNRQILGDVSCASSLFPPLEIHVFVPRICMPPCPEPRGTAAFSSQRIRRPNPRFDRCRAFYEESFPGPELPRIKKLPLRKILDSSIRGSSPFGRSSTRRLLSSNALRSSPDPHLSLVDVLRSARVVRSCHQRVTTSPPRAGFLSRTRTDLASPSKVGQGAGEYGCRGGARDI